MTTPLDRLAAIRAAQPAEGLFAEKDWLLTPEPFVISAALAGQLEKLGHRLNLFQRACNELYHRSVSGQQPAWIAAYLDAGKPPGLIAYARRRETRAALPAIITPTSCSPTTASPSPSSTASPAASASPNGSIRPMRPSGPTT